MSLIGTNYWVTSMVVLIIALVLWLIGEQVAAQIAAENMSNVTEVRS